MQSEWQMHKGRRFMYANYSNMGEDAKRLAAEVAAAGTIVSQEPADSVLVLTDVRGTVASAEAVAIFKQSAVQTKRSIHKIAVVGVGGGLRKLLLEAITRFSGQNLVAFEDVEQAKDWLVQ